MLSGNAGQRGGFSAITLSLLLVREANAASRFCNKEADVLDTDLFQVVPRPVSPRLHSGVQVAILA